MGVPWNKGKTYAQLYGANADVVKEKGAAKHRGKRHSAETKLIMSEKAKARYAAGQPRLVGVMNPFYGKAHSTDMKLHLAEQNARVQRDLAEADPKGYSEKKRRAGLASVEVNNIRRGRTDIEQMMYDLLTGLSIKFQEQVTIGWYTVDFLVAELVVIEPMGHYWHSRQRPRDLARRRWLEEQGYLVFEYYDTTMKKAGFKQKLEKHLHSAGLL
jgi:very-short-patch-repair endonuclease